MKQVTELTELGRRMSSVAVDKFGVNGKISKLNNGSFRQILNCNLSLKYWCSGSFSYDYIPTLHNDTLAVINT